MNFFHEHLAHLLVGGSSGVGGAAFLSIVFRDGIKEWWAERKEEKRAARTARAAEASQGPQFGNQLLAVFRDDLKDRREHDLRVVQVLEAVKEILTRLEGKTDGQGKQLDIVHQRVITIQGAVGRVQ